MPVKFIDSIPSRRRPQGRRLTSELSDILNELRIKPGVWAEVEKATGTTKQETEKIHRKRFRYHSIMDSEGISGFEFTVRDGVLYGRKTPSQD